MLKMYDLLCTDCGKEFEKLIKSFADIECPFCGSLSTTPLPSAASIKVNGQGAYTNKMRV